MKKLIYFLICYWVRWNSFWELDEYPILGRTNIKHYLCERNLFNTDYRIWEFTAKMKSAHVIATFLRQLEKDIWGRNFATSWTEESNYVSVPAPWWIRMKMKEKLSA